MVCPKLVNYQNVKIVHNSLTNYHQHITIEDEVGELKRAFYLWEKFDCLSSVWVIYNKQSEYMLA